MPTFFITCAECTLLSKMTREGLQQLNNFSSFSHRKETIDDREWLTFRIVMATLTSLTLVVSSCLCFGIWSYERYGGDPQKRTILNQLFGQMALIILLCNLASLSTLLVRLISGPVQVIVAEVGFFIARAGFSTACLLTLNEMAMLRLMSIFMWKRLPPISDNFFGRFLWTLNLALSFTSAVGARMGSSDDTEMYFILTGQPFLRTSHTPTFRYAWIFHTTIGLDVIVFRFYGTTLLVTLIVYTFYGTFHIYKLYKATHQVSPTLTVDNNGSSYNTSESNLGIASFSINVMSLASYLAYMYFVLNEWMEEDIQPAVVGTSLTYCIVTVAMPLKTWIVNPEIWAQFKSSWYPGT